MHDLPSAPVEAAPATYTPTYTPTPTPTGEAVPEVCVSCDRPAGTPYCAHCGQPRAADLRQTVGAFVRDLIEGVTDLDGRLWATVHALVVRPGALTAAYARGERRRYLAPLRVFVLANVAYFVCASWSGTHTFDTPLRVHVAQTAHATVARRMVDDRLAERRTSFAAYAATFDRVATTQAKSLVVAIVPGFALAASVVTWRRRRSVVQDAVFALHAVAVLLLLFVAVHYVVDVPLAYANQAFGWSLTGQRFDDLGSSAYSLAAGTYLYHAVRAAYGDGRRAAAAKAFWLVLAFWCLLFAYRVLLFFATFATT